ncbi:MAG: 50S ribosomal protein L23 [Ktedonobacterales bacterium]
MEITEIIRHGLITEQSVDMHRTKSPDGNIVPRYTFRVALEANKYQIRDAVEAMFPGVKVTQVNTMRMPGKVRTVRTRKGIFTKEARPWKKAVVTLADGQTIPELQA